MRQRAKAPKVRCKNCGEWTQFLKTSIGDRDKKQWCNACYKTWEKNASVTSTGRVIWKDDVYPRSIIRETRYDTGHIHDQED